MSEEEIIKYISDNKDMSNNKLKEILNIPLNKISKIRKENNIENPFSQKYFLTEDQINYIIENATKYSSYELAEMFKVSNDKIKKIWRKYGVKQKYIFGKREEKCAIYMIKNQINGKVYIGSAVNVQQRWITHRNDLMNNKHHSIHLQRAWNKYGEINFIFGVLEYVDNVNDLLKREQFYLDKYKSYDNKIGYNISPKAGSRLGVPFSKEVREKMSIQRRGKKRNLSEESRKSLIEKLKNRPSRKGFKHTEETKKKMSERMKGNTYSKGRKHSDETMKKLQISYDRYKIERLGEGNPASVLTEQDVHNICQLILGHKNNKEILEILNLEISQGTIQNIRSKKTWNQISDEYFDKPMPYGRSSINEEQAKEVKYLLSLNKYNALEIAEMTGVKRQHVYDIKANRIWKEV